MKIKIGSVPYIYPTPIAHMSRQRKLLVEMLLPKPIGSFLKFSFKQHITDHVGAESAP